MSDIIKICKIHGSLTANAVYYLKKQKIYRCKQCNLITQQRHLSKHPGAHAKRNRTHYLNWTEDVRAQKNAKRNIQTQELHDNYIKSLLRRDLKIRTADITPEYIAIRRDIIKLKRAIKEMEDNNK